MLFDSCDEHIDLEKTAEQLGTLIRNGPYPVRNLAECLHVSIQTIYRLSYPGNFPSLELAVYLAKIYEVHVEDLVVLCKANK